MVAWQIWLIVAGLSFILEAITVGFLVFWFGVAALITSLLSLFIPNIVAQAAIFILLSAIFILFTRKFADKITKKDNVKTNADTNLNKTGIVIKKIDSTNQKPGQVKIDSEVWTAISEDETDIAKDTKVKVSKIEGVKLVVTPIK